MRKEWTRPCVECGCPITNRKTGTIHIRCPKCSRTCHVDRLRAAAAEHESDFGQEGPRRLVVDIETFPALGYAWDVHEARFLRTVENTSIAAFCAKWIGGKSITRCLADYEGYRGEGDRDDRALLTELWPLLNDAHIVIAHNGIRFDRKKINYRFMVNGFGPPSPYKLVDTYRESASVSGFDSHRLNELCRLLGIGEKLRTGGADLWFDCLAGRPAAWKRMRRYNTRDVDLTEELYLLLLPWMLNHPNVGAYTGISSCPKCGSTKLVPDRVSVASTRKYQRFQCVECGSWSRSSEKLPGRTAVVTAR